MDYLVCVSCLPNSEQERHAIAYCKTLTLEPDNKARIFFFGKAASSPYKNVDLWVDIFSQANIDPVICSQSLKHFGESYISSELTHNQNYVDIAGLGTLVEGAAQAQRIINFSNIERAQPQELENQKVVTDSKLTYLIVEQNEFGEHSEALIRAIDSLNVFLAFNQSTCLIISNKHLDYLRRNDKLLSMSQELGLTELELIADNTKHDLGKMAHITMAPIVLSNEKGKDKQIQVKQISKTTLNTIKQSFKYISYN